MNFIKVNLPKYKKFFFIFIVLFSLIIWLPYKDGKSSYAYSELLRDINVEKTLAQGNLILLGPTSRFGDFHFGPIYYYLLYPFAYLFNFSLYSLACASLFFSIATLMLSFYVIKKWWSSEPLAYITIIIMSLSILNFQLAKYGSNPNFIPFFSLLFFYSFERLVNKPNQVFFTILMSISFAVATQLHLVPLLALSLVFIIAVTKRALRFDLKNLLLFLSITIIIYSPYLYYEFTHHFENIRNLFQISENSLGLSKYFIRFSEYVTFWLAPFLSVHSFFNVFLLLKAKYVLLIIAIFLPIIPILNYNLKKPKFIDIDTSIHFTKSVKTTISYWLIAPSIILLLPTTVEDYQIYYFFIFLPLIFFLYGLGFIFLLKRGLHLIFSYLAGIFLILQLIQIFLYNQLVLKL